MRVHTSLTRQELYSCLPDGVDANITEHGSRKRERAFEVTLFVYEKDNLHRRLGNSGGYGASSDVAATWDEWGIWIDNVYEKDPRAQMAYYESYSDFMQKTRTDRDRIRAWNKADSVQVRTHTAPWLNDTPKGRR